MVQSSLVWSSFKIEPTESTKLDYLISVVLYYSQLQFQFQFLSTKFSNFFNGCWHLLFIFHFRKNPKTPFSLTHKPFLILASSANASPRLSLRTSSNSNPKASFIINRKNECVTVRQLALPLSSVWSGLFGIMWWNFCFHVMCVFYFLGFWFWGILRDFGFSLKFL